MFKSTHCSLLYNWLFHNVLARLWGFNIDNSMLDLISDWRTSTDGSWNTMHHPRIQWLTGTGWRGHTRHSLQYMRTYICKMMEHIFAFWSNMYQSGGFIMRQVRNILCNMTENIFSAHYPCRTHLYTKNIGKRRTWHWVPGLRDTHTHLCIVSILQHHFHGLSMTFTPSSSSTPSALSTRTHRSLLLQSCSHKMYLDGTPTPLKSLPTPPDCFWGVRSNCNQGWAQSQKRW